MSYVRLGGNAAGTGVIEITTPNTNTNRTVALPDSSGAVVLDSATQSFTNKSFDSAPVSTVSGTAPISFCRAWVNFNGTGTLAVRGSSNVSSVTDNGTGDYTVNFTTAMPDVNYAANTSVGYDNPGGAAVLRQSTEYSVSRAAASLRLYTDYTYSGGYSVEDQQIVSVSVFR
jgi:hypothetical protein